MSWGDRSTTAHHEAAHAVVALRFGSTVHGVILDGPELEPRNLLAVSLNVPTGEPIVDIAVAAAGYRAQLRLEPDDLDSAMLGLGMIESEAGTAYSHHSDYEHMLLAATPGYGRWWKAARTKPAAGGMTRAQLDHVLATRGQDRELMWGVAADVGKLLEDPGVWDSVVAVAEALMQRGRLSGREIRELVA